jgi:hypothetical protein
MARRFVHSLVQLSRAWHVWVPVLILMALCTPRLTLLLPAPVDFSDEIYQPQQAMRFLASKGQAFEKYGPTGSLLVAPPLGATLAYWKLTGDLNTPGPKWPYGFARPVDQLGVLVFQTRLVHLLLACFTLAVVALALARLTGSKLACLLVVVGNYNFVWVAPLARPDSSMVAFVLIALALVARMTQGAIGKWNAIALGLCSAAAVSAKENAAPIFVLTLPCLLLFLWTDSRHDKPRRSSIRRTAVWTIASGFLAYVITNIALAPSVWLKRMQYWLVGDGLSGDVWARSATFTQHLQLAGEAMLNNLGPAGAILVSILCVIALIRRPLLSTLLIVPFAACLLTVLKIPYTPDRFVLPGAVSLVFVSAMGLGVCLRSKARWPAIVLCVLGVCVNLWWTTITFHLARTTEQAMLEHVALAEPRERTKSYAVMFDDSPALRRLEWLGHAVDRRAMQHWTDLKRAKPEIVFANTGRMQMLEEAKSMPGRAAHYDAIAGFDLGKWPGMAALGYAPPQRVTLPPPGHLRWFRWMPLNKEFRHRDIMVYRLQTP